MTKILSLFLLLSTHASAFNAIITCASTNLTTSYSTSAPSLPTALKQIPMPYKASMAIINNSTVRICANTDTYSVTVAPTAGNGDEHCVAPSMFAFYDNINFPAKLVNIYLRADVSSCTSGTVDIDLW